MMLNPLSPFAPITLRLDWSIITTGWTVCRCFNIYEGDDDICASVDDCEDDVNPNNRHMKVKEEPGTLTSLPCFSMQAH
jgi:hypothetical protein